MGTAALVGFMATLTDRRFTATQFALLSALFAVPRVIISSFTGYMQHSLGWAMFFIVCALAAIPGLLLIPLLRTGGNNGEHGVPDVILGRPSYRGPSRGGDDERDVPDTGAPSRRHNKGLPPQRRESPHD
jgi:hypothetical protein